MKSKVRVIKDEEDGGTVFEVVGGNGDATNAGDLPTAMKLGREWAALDWYESTSADDTHPDEEVDLDGEVGSPGGAVWAYVTLEDAPSVEAWNRGIRHGEWAWGVLDAWLWEGAEHLAHGIAPTKEEAKEAVLKWVLAQR